MRHVGRDTIRILAILLTCTAADSVHGADTGNSLSADKTPIVRHSGDIDSTMTRATDTASPGKTLVILGLMLAGAIVARRLVQQRRQLGSGRVREPVVLLGRQVVDGELTVRLLQVGPRVLVVGSAPQGLTTLAQITEPAEIAALTGDRTTQVSLFDGRTPIADSPRAERASSSVTEAIPQTGSAS